MLIIHNRFIPSKEFAAINICGILFARPGIVLDDEMLRHEAIHTRQQLEMLFIPFFVLYLIEWVVRLIRTRKPIRAYYQISFEKEAYQNQSEKDYLKRRKPMSWLKYL